MASVAVRPGGLLEALRQAASLLPRGGTLPATVWQRRHRFVVVLLAVHAIGLAAYTYGSGRPIEQVSSIFLGLGLPAVIAAAPFPSRTARSLAATAGLLAASAFILALTGGATAAHLHLFVVTAILALYHEWTPLVLAGTFVFLHHGYLGGLEAGLVYATEAEAEAAWRLAVVHTLFVVAVFACFAIQWRTDEDLRDDARELLSASGESVIGLDPDGRITFANPAAIRLLGLPETMVVGRTAMALMPDLRLPEGEGSQAKVSEGAYRAPGGAQVPVECLVTPSRRRGILRGYVVAVRDLTDRRAAEQERVRAREQEVHRLRELAEERTQFINNAAHELRTPLMPLGLQLDLLELKLGADEAKPEHLGAVRLLRRNFDRLRELVDDLVNVARLEARRLPVRQEPVDLTACLAELRTTFEPAASTRGHRLVAHVEPGLWVTGDALRLNQVFSNLLANAMRYTDAPGRIELTAARHASAVDIRVSDTGRGLTPDQLGRLFQPFSQVHGGVAAERLGTGLGLYITKSLVELHGGSITASSAGPGFGSSFTVTLPALPAPAPTSPSSTAPVVAVVGRGEGQPGAAAPGALAEAIPSPSSQVVRP